MLIIFRKSDGAIASNSGTNSYLPDGPVFAAEVQNAVNKLGGIPDDYGEYRLHDEQEAGAVQEIMAAGSYALAFEGDEPHGVIAYPRINITANKEQITADGLDTAIITADVGDSSDTDDIEFFVDGVSVGLDTAVNGVATLEFTATSPGTYRIEAESKTPGPPGFQYKHGRASLTVEVIDSA